MRFLSPDIVHYLASRTLPVLTKSRHLDATLWHDGNDIDGGLLADGLAYVRRGSLLDGTAARCTWLLRDGSTLCL